MQTCFVQLRLSTKISLFLSSTDLEKVIHAFISFRLYYCNTLYSVISRNIQRLQLAARILTRPKTNSPIITSPLVTKSDQAFATWAPQLWISLPRFVWPDPRPANSVSCFKSLLETHFFSLKKIFFFKQCYLLLLFKLLYHIFFVCFCTLNFVLKGAILMKLLFYNNYYI